MFSPSFQLWLEFHCLYSIVIFISLNCSIHFYGPFPFLVMFIFPLIFLVNLARSLFFINIFQELALGSFGVLYFLFLISWILAFNFIISFLLLIFGLICFSIFTYTGHTFSDAILCCSIKADNTQTNGQNYVSTKLYLKNRQWTKVSKQAIVC